MKYRKNELKRQMTPEEPFDRPEKLNVDKKKRFHLQLPDGKEQIIELTDKEIETVENWFALLGKHNIRFEIETIVQIFNELNLTEISHMVRQSKSTVDRHLRSMEEDGLLLSRRGDATEQGRIPPKLYQLNRKLYEILQNAGGSIITPEPSEPKKLRERYQREIKTCRSVIFLFISLLKMMNPLLNMFENQLSDVDLAKQTFEDYFNLKMTIPPSFGYTYVNKKYVGQCFEANREFTKKLQEIFNIQNADPEAKEREFVYFNTLLPIRKLFEIYKKEILEKQ